MLPDTIFSLALLSRSSDRCPRCNFKLVRKTAFLKIGVRKQADYAQASVLFCPNCRDYYSNETLMAEAKEHIPAAKHRDKKSIHIPSHSYAEKRSASVLSKSIQIYRDSEKEKAVPHTEGFMDIGSEKTKLQLRSQFPQKISPKNVILTLGRRYRHEFIYS